jgi:hypothetical protein
MIPMGMEPIANKKIIFFICLTLVLILLLYPFSVLVEDYIRAAPLIGQEEEVILSEPAMMFLLGSGLIGVGIFTRKTLKKKTKIS